MRKFLTIRGLRAPRINASNHMHAGVPGPGAFYGLGYAIVRALNALEAHERGSRAQLVTLQSVTIGVSEFRFVNSRKKFVPLHEDDKPATPMGLVDECMGDLTFSLILEVELDGDAALPSSSQLTALLAAQRFCGSYVETATTKLWLTDTLEHALQKLRGRMFVLRDASPLVSAHQAQGLDVATIFERLLRLTSSAADAAASSPLDVAVPSFGVAADSATPAPEAPYESPQSEIVPDLFDTELEPIEAVSDPVEAPAPYYGWLLPTLIGYRLLEAPRERRGGRGGFAHAYAEPLMGLLRAQLVGSVLAEHKNHGEWPEVQFRPRTLPAGVLVYSALSDSALQRTVGATP